VDVHVSAGEQQEVARGDLTALRLALTQESFEKDASQKSCAELRVDVKRLDAEKTQLSHVVHELTQKISGTYMARGLTWFTSHHRRSQVRTCANSSFVCFDVVGQ